jgi:hypothetical protein
MDVPHRYDLEQISFVNKEVNKYYRRLQKHMKLFKNTEVIKIDLDRRSLTKHGQHMNAKGKELMAKRIAAAIKHTLKVCEKTPISMKWKGSTENQGSGETKIGVGEGRDLIENHNDSVSVENNNSRWEEDETAMKASRRCQNIPVTRRDDFLWTTTSKKSQGRKGGENKTKTKT